MVIGGDDTTLLVQLYNSAGAKFVINNTATIKVAIVNLDHTRVIVAAVICSNATPGAVWATSLVAVVFTAAQTATIASNDQAWLEIEVLDTIKTTYFERVKLVKGLIT